MTERDELELMARHLESLGATVVLAGPDRYLVGFSGRPRALLTLRSAQTEPPPSPEADTEPIGVG